jgi:hypothetical protein
MAELVAPAVFESRSTYRLLDADLRGPLVATVTRPAMRHRT